MSSDIEPSHEPDPGRVRLLTNPNLRSLFRVRRSLTLPLMSRFMVGVHGRRTMTLPINPRARPDVRGSLLSSLALALPQRCGFSLLVPVGIWPLSHGRKARPDICPPQAL